MIVYRNIVQGTSAWAALRAGIPTTSMFSKIMTPGKKKSESQDAYLNHLIAERMLGRPIDGFQSQAMAEGSRSESNAVAAYEFQHNVTTEKVGFVLSDDGLIGCSPDRWIIEHPRRGLEVKAPGSPAIHVAYLRSATGASKEYIVQLMGQCWLCEKDEVEIISFFPGMPNALFRIQRDESFIKELSAHVREFSARLEEMSADFVRRGWMKPRLSMQEMYSLSDDGVDRSSMYVNQDDVNVILSRSIKSDPRNVGA
jgi:hypothetical protein